jgi:H+-translocating NAD(P) transhydrogenase subunit alpha
MSGNLLLEAYVFVLALFVGFQLISRVPPILHTPLMSGTNAIHGIILVGAIVLAGSARGALGTAIGAAAVFLATVNVVGGFVVTDRMLEMFKQRPGPRRKAEGGRRKTEDGRREADDGSTSASRFPSPGSTAQEKRRT